MELKDAVMIAAYAQEKGWVTEKYGVRPLEPFRMDQFLKNLDADQTDFDDPENVKRVRDLLPALMVSYIRAGAKVALEPALDKDFQCIDFLTVLDVEELSPQHRKKFVEASSGESP